MNQSSCRSVEHAWISTVDMLCIRGFHAVECDFRLFLFIEYPVGCWYCEMPEPAGIVYIQMSPGITTTFQRGLVRLVGHLALNGNDPEDFLFAIRDAHVAGVD